MKELAIIILHHNSPKETNECLKSLEKAWLPSETEILVINNGTKGDEPQLNAASYKNLNLIFFDIPNRGYPQGNNFGLQHTKARYYAFTNPDIVVNPDTFRVLLDYLNQNPEVGIAAPQLLYPDGTIQDNFRVFPRFWDLIIKRTPWLRRRFPERMRDYLMWDKEPDLNEAVDWVTGALMVVSDKCLAKIGRHDENFFLFMSDLSLCRDAWQNGYEVHLVGKARALHNEQRLSSGGFLDFFKKKSLRIHVSDALKYYEKYSGKALPEKSPSLSHIRRRDRLLHTRGLKAGTFLQAIGNKLQRHNPVVSVYAGKVQGKLNYEQPVVFFGTGVCAVVINESGKIGLMKVWRHVPLQFHKKNTFPIFPDISDLGVWTLECPRGGIEKSDISPEAAIKRELQEEIGLQEKDIVKIKRLGRVIGNTAIDVYSHVAFEVIVKDNFYFKSAEEVETIKDFKFYNKEELAKLVKEEKLFCGISKATILESLLSENFK